MLSCLRPSFTATSRLAKKHESFQSFFNVRLLIQDLAFRCCLIYLLRIRIVFYVVAREIQDGRPVFVRKYQSCTAFVRCQSGVGWCVSQEQSVS